MKSGIYAITTPSDRMYIGSAVNFGHRWAVHLYNLRRNQHHSPALQNAYNKYGEAALSFRKLIICSKDDLLFFEQRAINAYPPDKLYNTSPVAGSQLGFKHSEATKAAYSAARKGVVRGPRDPAVVQKIADAKRGQKYSAQARANQSAGQRGRKKSPEHIAKVAAARRGHKYSPEMLARRRRKGEGISGVVGIHTYGNNRWRVAITRNGVDYRRGPFDELEEAKLALQQLLDLIKNGEVPPP